MPYIEVDVESGGNSDLSMVRMFDALEQPREVTLVPVAMRPDGWEGPCMVTGWSSDGPCAAYAAKVMDSGDGAVLLVYGGDEGIRLKPSDSVEEWDLEATGQWGEPCLMLEVGAEVA
ncbi:MAG: hypothetical protein WD645_02125 [Dehalococcoidia bacterium]